MTSIFHTVFCSAVLLAAFFPRAEPSVQAADELLKNPDFAKKLDDWEFNHAAEYRDKLAAPRVKKDRDRKSFAVLDVPYASNALYIRLQQPVAIREGQVYRVRFEVRAEKSEGPVLVVISQRDETGTPRVNGLNILVKAGPTWTKAEALFKAQNITTHEPAGFRVCFGNFEGPVEVRNFSLKLAEDQSVKLKKRFGDLVGETADKPGTNPSEALDEAADTPAGPRIWTSTGGTTLEGTLEQVDGGFATIKRASDGKAFRIPTSKLSREDQAFIRNRNPE